MREGRSKWPGGTVSAGNLCFHLKLGQGHCVRGLGPGGPAEAGAVLDENPGVRAQGASAMPCHLPEVVASQAGPRCRGRPVTLGGRGPLSPRLQKHQGMKVNTEAVPGRI